MHFDATVTLGALLQIITFLVAILLAFVKLRERLVRIEVQVEPLWSAFCQVRAERGTAGADE